MTANLRKALLSSYVLLAFLFAGSAAAFAQSEIKGTVYDTSKPTPMTGATVVVQGKNAASITDIDGKFSLNASEGDVLLVQFMGYHDQTVTVGKSSVYEIVMTPDSEQLQEVIVTALGMKREKRSLGYAATDVAGEELSAVQNSNWLSGLQGKVAGVQFNGASSGPISSQRVVVRGESSLSGNSSALFVVDGVPITSGAISNASGSLYTNQDNPIDFGDGASDINPDDIESITVLKGAAATALYGSRAGNGAIIITTKSGRTTKGIGVSWSSSFTADLPSYFPDFQKEYGSGNDMGLNEYNNFSADYNAEGLNRNQSRYAFGEAFGDGTKMRYQYAGMNWETGIAERTPWQYQDDWFSGIFQTGYTWDNTLTLEGGNGKGTSVRLSFKDTRNEWILPNTGYTKQTVSLSVNSQLHKAIKLNAKVNYYRTDSDNMPSSAYNNNSVMYQILWSKNTDSMKNYYDEYFLGRWNADTYKNFDYLVQRDNYYNPYRTLYEMTNSMDKDRVFGTVGLNINLWKDKITLDVKTGIDLDYSFRTQRKPKYTYNYPDGWYREQTNMRMEMNTDFMLKYQDAFVNDKLTLVVGFGGNNMTYNRNSYKYTIDRLEIEGVYNTINYPAGTIPDISTYRSKKVVNSLYGLASIGWDDWAYLDITARNDWTSTLSPGYWSYFYPSVSASLVLDRLFNFSTNLPWFTFLKLRGSWANVGKDTDPYAISYTYSSTDFAGSYRPGATMPDVALAPENVETWEVGLEAKFLKNRIGLDVAVYQSDITDQIFDVPYDYMTGAKYYTQNIGLIRNRGIEIAMNFVPVRTKNWTWNISVNASRNVGVLMEMYDGWDNTVPHQADYGTTIGSRLYVYNYVGRQMGELWGKGVTKTQPGAYYIDANGNKVDCSNQVILDEKTGLTSDSSDLRYLGNVNPDWTGGLTTSLRWKNLTVGMTFSAQLGGNTYSVTAGILGYQGKLKNSLEGRYDGFVAPGVNLIYELDDKGNKVPKLDENGNQICKVNETLCSDVQAYYNKGVGNRYNFEEYTYDTSFLKMKELRIEYSLPESLLDRQKVKILQGASIAAYATNLFCISNYPFFDPEVGSINGGDIKRGIEAGSFPMNRSFGFNLKLKF